MSVGDDQFKKNQDEEQFNMAQWARAQRRANKSPVIFKSMSDGVVVTTYYKILYV